MENVETEINNMIVHVAGIENCTEVIIKDQKFDDFTTMKVLPENRIAIGGLKSGYFLKSGNFECIRFNQEEASSFYDKFCEEIFPDQKISLCSLQIDIHVPMQLFLTLFRESYIISIGNLWSQKILNDFLVFSSFAEEVLDKNNFSYYLRFIHIFKFGANNGIVTFYRHYDSDGMGT